MTAGCWVKSCYGSVDLAWATMLSAKSSCQLDVKAGTPQNDTIENCKYI